MQTAKLLVDKGASPDAVNSHNVTTLYDATTSGNLSMMQFFLDRGGKIDAGDYSGNTPLSLTASETGLEAFNLLIDRGADVNVCNADGETLLMEVCSSSEASNSTRLIQQSKAALLIKEGVSVNAQSDPSLAAQKFSNLLEGFGVDRAMASSGQTALMFAVRQGDAEMIKLLIANGADLSIADGKGQTALIHACRTEKRDIAVLLLDNQADPNSVDSTGMTPLMIATQEDDLELVKILVAKGADTEFKNDDGKNADFFIVHDGKIDKDIKRLHALHDVKQLPEATAPE